MQKEEGKIKKKNENKKKINERKEGKNIDD